MENYVILLGYEIPGSILLLISFVSSALITYYSIPAIVKIAQYKKLFDFPNDRTSHKNAVPVLGGLAIFAAFSITIVVTSVPVSSLEVKFLLGGVIILFLLGLKDDILLLDPKKKLIGQIVASSVVIILGGIRMTSLHNVLGIDSLSYTTSVIVTLFIFLSFINGFNLVDGIDGLTSGIGILISIFYGIWFILKGDMTYAVISMSLLGTLTIYFFYNVFGSKNKIFMGDTGAMIIGLIAAVLTIKYLESALQQQSGRFAELAPAISFGLVIVPLFDTLRVFILRLIDGVSPFKADKRHIHHLLLEGGLSHIKATFVLILVTLLMLVLIICLKSLGNMILILISIAISGIMAYLLASYLKKKGHSAVSQRNGLP